MNLDKLANQLGRAKIGDFWLTDAIRPAPAGAVLPRQGYRTEIYEDRRAGLRVPVLAAAVSRPRLFDLFLDLLEPLGDTVDVVLESSHASTGGRHQDFCREHIDLPILASQLYDFEDLLLHDGYTGIAVISTSRPIEVQFDEHKLLLVYAPELAEFEMLVQRAGVLQHQGLPLITEGEHLHCSQAGHPEAFEQLCYRLGVSQAVEPVRW